MTLKHKFHILLPAAAATAVLFTANAFTPAANAQNTESTTSTLGVPLKPDPPPAIDGDLNDWNHVPALTILDDREHVTTGRSKWKSPDDLSAKIWVAWRADQLYLAAEVTDDRVRQTMRGGKLWQGDHLELYLDTIPENEPARKIFGKGQFHFGFSPGNFQNSGDALADIKPEAVVFAPAGIGIVGVLVAAQRTAQGYNLEAAIPWNLVGVKPQIGTQLGLEVGVSDADSDTPEQKSMMTLSPAAFTMTRPRLLPAMLSPADGKAPPTARGVEIANALEVKAGDAQQLTFEVAAPPVGREGVLKLQERLDFPRSAGYTGALKISLNGGLLNATRLLNKKPTEERADGKTKNMMQGEAFNADFGPDFVASDSSPNYALKQGKVHELELRVTDLIRPGANELKIENVVPPPATNMLVLGDVALQWRAVVAPVVKKGPPVGTLETYAPQPISNLKYAVQQQTNNDLVITWNRQTFRAASEFSTPEGVWKKTSNRYFKLARTFEKRGDVIVVRDTFTNLSDEKLPLMQRHILPIEMQKAWLGGLTPAKNIGLWSDAGNPTCFAATEKVGLGLMPLDDVFRVHSTNTSDGKSLGLEDRNLVLAPRATHVSEWAIALTPTPDYFDFVNTMRRFLDVNFSIDGSFAFLRSEISLGGHDKEWTDELVTNFIRNKSAKYVCISISYPRYKDRGDVYAHGTAFQTLDLSQWKKEVDRRRRLVPGISQLGYYHCFLDESDDAAEKYPDARVLRADGTQGDYGKPWEKEFVPTLQNSFGKDVAKSVDIIQNDLGFDGVYWDEIERSRDTYTYSEPWDGVSGDIDPQTLKIRRLKSSVTLLSQPWRIALAEKIMSRGALVANGAPYTRTMAKLHFPRFTETGSISNCTLMQLFTPIALGDSHTEESELDAYRNMLRALDYGCVYYWYNDWTVRPTYPTLTKYMFPITPMELCEGVVIGKERILTNRSGIFGWNDQSKHEIHVFDDTGRETTKFAAPIRVKTTTQQGKTFSELRLPEDWSAAIIRR
jgi:hypothetical protein